MIKDFKKDDDERLETLIRFGLPAYIYPDKERTMFSFDRVLYWGRKKQPANEPWPTDADDILPNEINVFSMRKNLCETGTGSTPFEAYENSILRMHKRREKRGADFILLIGGNLIKNGATFYYTLQAQVYKVDQQAEVEREKRKQFYKDVQKKFYKRAKNREYYQRKK